MNCVWNLRKNLLKLGIVDCGADTNGISILE